MITIILIGIPLVLSQTIDIQKIDEQQTVVRFRLGTAIKFITGNIYTNDAIFLNNQIQNLKNSTAHIETILTNQDQINTKMKERLKNVTEHINKEQDKIENYINKLTNNILKEDDILFELH